MLGCLRFWSGGIPTMILGVGEYYLPVDTPTAPISVGGIARRKINAAANMAMVLADSAVLADNILWKKVCHGMEPKTCNKYNIIKYGTV